MSLRERFAQGKWFTESCENLSEDKRAAKKRMKAFNKTGIDQSRKRKEWLAQIFGRETNAHIEPPFYFCYGTNIELGDHCFLGMNCNFVDEGKIIIGKQVTFGPNVSIATVGHLVYPDDRGYRYIDPVQIEDNCWIGASTVICPGVTIGANSVIAAESVVTKDIPANVIAAGNPCKVIKSAQSRTPEYNGIPGSSIAK